MIKEDDVFLYLTCGDDNKLLLHDLNSKKVIGEGVVRPDEDIKSLPKKKKKGGASTQAKTHVHQQARALAYNF